MIAAASTSGVLMSGCLPSAAMVPERSMVPATRYEPPVAPLLNSAAPTLNSRGITRIEVDPEQYQTNDWQERPSQPTNPWEPVADERDWQYIVIHHTASDGGTVESIHNAHSNRKDSAGNAWLGIGYHFVIGNGNGMGDGEIEPTFRWNEQMHGAHAGISEYNQQGIGVALIGNFDEQPPTPAQISAVKQLVGVLKNEYQISSDRVIGHGDVKATACPGKYFPLSDVSQSEVSSSYTGTSRRPSTIHLADSLESRNL